MDETTDVATQKSLVVVIRFYDEKVTDHFFGLLEIHQGTSNEIDQTTINHLKNNNIPLTKMIGLAADNAAVMMGNIKGVQALFRQDVPSLFVMGCICHTFHLCASAAAIKLPNTLEEFARGVYNFFSNSSKRLRFLNECQSFLDEKPHKMLHPSQTRWLSLQEVVNRILLHWNSLKLVFQDAVLAENLQSFQTTLNNLNDPIYKLYFLFLSYVLEIVNQLPN
ncbi:uncharacterized protein LOC115889120 [Sitophilus oryzae]|uniref:Uncharacterized protein LOC115889120 n=1 Tax=Sitophilus oryzae TaxID=7048 RepID=A0A6J2YNS7_SITOR|nr:uncharacterized protein LOC115889120 [Sitophilus oryzae]